MRLQTPLWSRDFSHCVWNYCTVSLSVLYLFFFLGEVIIPVSFQLEIDLDFSTDLLNRSSSRFVALEENIRQAVRRLLWFIIIIYLVFSHLCKV